MLPPERMDTILSIAFRSLLQHRRNCRGPTKIGAAVQQARGSPDQRASHGPGSRKFYGFQAGAGLILFFLTMHVEIQHMIKYRYVPFTMGKARYNRNAK
ncbi:hypothetical protein F5883DRAFT_651818 [Diaporthe sp. PMI_573]|nr:hypothetical protein F5883DRAFT_651818 [Diaporthaceae sp. PMI_573]